MLEEAKLDKHSPNRLSLWLSLVFAGLWAAAVLLVYFGGPFWLQILLGAVGVVVAIADYKYVRQKARAAVLSEEPNRKHG